MARQRLDELPGKALGDAVEAETDAGRLVDFISSSECVDTRRYYEEVTAGRQLISWPHPEEEDMTLRLPPDVSPQEYLRKYRVLTDRWLAAKQRAVERLAELDVEALASLLERPCGFLVDYQIRRVLLSKDPKCRREIERSVSDFAVKELGLSRHSWIRALQLRRVARRVRAGTVHPRYKAAYEHYLRLGELLRAPDASDDVR